MFVSVPLSVLWSTGNENGILIEKNPYETNVLTVYNRILRYPEVKYEIINDTSYERYTVLDSLLSLPIDIRKECSQHMIMYGKVTYKDMIKMDEELRWILDEEVTYTSLKTLYDFIQLDKQSPFPPFLLAWIGLSLMLSHPFIQIKSFFK
jgi:hypothetical protein